MVVRLYTDYQCLIALKAVVMNLIQCLIDLKDQFFVSNRYAPVRFGVKFSHRVNGDLDKHGNSGGLFAS